MSAQTTRAQDTIRLTMSQALVRFLKVQMIERDGVTQPFFGGALGIFGHGNVGGIGEAFLQEVENFRFIQGRHEQGMAHMAVGYAKMKNRLGCMAVSTSIGPGAANLVTAAGTATANRLPLLLLPSDTFATRRVGSVLQQIENEQSTEITTNDAFRAVSRYWDRISRPEQLPPALMEAMRTLTDPAATGAVTLCLPQDVQAEAFDYPVDLFQERVWHVARSRADVDQLERAVALIKASKRPVIFSGGGTIYSDATEDLLKFVEQTGIPVGVTQSGKASMPWDHELTLGAMGTSGMEYANSVARDADLVIGIGTRYTDFTSASNTLFQNPDVRFVNLNVMAFDALKESATMVLGDARESLRELAARLGKWTVSKEYRAQVTDVSKTQRDAVDAMIAPVPGATVLAQEEVIGIVNEHAQPRDVVVAAAGSLPGDLHRLWRAGSPLSYGMEYGYSCMAYEIPGGLGARIGDPTRNIFTFIGDGSFLMYHQELITAVQENEKMIVLLIDNGGFGSINSLSHAVGSQGFETNFNMRGNDGRQDPTRSLQIDYTSLVQAYGMRAIRVDSAEELHQALNLAVDATDSTVIYVPVDPVGRFGSGAFWEVATPEVSSLETSQKAHEVYSEKRKLQGLYL